MEEKTISGSVVLDTAVTIDTLNRLGEFSANMNFWTFEKLWVDCGGTKNMADHLWNKWNNNRRDLIYLWLAMDSGNQLTFIKLLSKIKPFER